MGSRFIRPDTKTLTLANGDTLIVKKRLNSGEQRSAFARMYLAGVDGSMKVNPLQVGMAVITAYLLDWSLRDDDGRPVVIRGVSVEDVTAALDNLSPEDFAEIRTAIETHETVMAQERAAEKNGQAGETTPAATSPLPYAATGPSSTSETLM